MSSTAGAIPAPSDVPPGTDPTSTSLTTIWLAASVVMITVPSIFVMARLYVKFNLFQQVTLADYFCSFSWIFMLADLSLYFTLMDYGVGKHGWNISPEDYSMFAELVNQIQFLYMPAIFFVKAAILVQFLDLFVTQRRSARWWILWIMIVANAIFFTILFFLEIFQCLPREKIWNPNIPGKCINISQTFVATGTINVLDDFLILSLPLFWIWKLRIRKERKIGVAAIFATGLFACVCSIMRLVESVAALSSPDITFTLPPVALWAAAELSSGLVVCCLPFIPPIFFSARRRASHSHGSNTNYDGTPLRARHADRANTRYAEMRDADILSQPEHMVQREMRRKGDGSFVQPALDGAAEFPSRDDHYTFLQRVESLEDSTPQLQADPIRPLPAIYRTTTIRQTSERIQLDP